MASFTKLDLGMSFLITLLDPTMCKDCRFNCPSLVDTGDGRKQPMIHCKRRDCDNWMRPAVQHEVLSVEDLNEA